MSETIETADQRHTELPPLGVADIVVLFSAVLAPIAAWILLIHRLGWLLGFLVGWLIGPIAAGVALSLVMVWTIPLRGADILSVSRRFRRNEGPPDADHPDLAISVIMPVYNAQDYIAKSLPPLIEAQKRGEILEVIVVDDGSTDGTADLARKLGAQVTPSASRLGPGAARNNAAKISRGEVLWFVDADVVIHNDTASYIRAAFADPENVAVFGSYDDGPPARNFGSQYKNLVHHHYHQNADPGASTFWSGCGAVRKDAFLSAGGFDAQAFNRPSIEDVELGYRLRAKGGKILLDRRLLSTHLKVWTIVELVRTDIFRRALPWARLMLSRAEVLDDLNVGTVERLRAALAGLTLMTFAAVVAGLLPGLWLIPVLLTMVTGNWHLFRLFVRTRGLGFGLAALAFHQVYYLYSTAAFLWCWMETRLPQRGRAL